MEQLLIKHSRQVAERALLICDKHPELSLDRQFLYEAAMLHDIGIRWCYAPGIGCYGEKPYIQHGQIGGDLLRVERMPRHARVAERHTGTGLPGFEPETMEEQVICYADKFFSKSHPDIEKSPAQVCESLRRFGEDGPLRFQHWDKIFGI